MFFSHISEHFLSLLPVSPTAPAFITTTLLPFYIFHSSHRVHTLSLRKKKKAIIMRCIIYFHPTGGNEMLETPSICWQNWLSCSRCSKCANQVLGADFCCRNGRQWRGVAGRKWFSFHLLKNVIKAAAVLP